LNWNLNRFFREVSTGHHRAVAKANLGATVFAKLIGPLGTLWIDTMGIKADQKLERTGWLPQTFGTINDR